jgi:hypothetical protein
VTAATTLPGMGVPVLWLYGADGVGTSVVAWEVYGSLTGQGRTAAYLDIDYLGFCTPQPGGDPTWLVERNLAAMWRTFAEAGARMLVAAGVIVTAEQRDRYAAAIPDSRLVLCRLRATPSTLAARIARRGAVDGASGLVEYGQRAARFAELLDRTDFADFTVDTDGIAIAEVARRVLEEVRTTAPQLFT